MPLPLPDYYAILDLKPGASQAEIKHRYRELALRYHPDVNPSPDAAQKIKIVNEAHRVLGDPDRRSQYDAERVLSSSTQKSREERASPGPSRHRQPSSPFDRPQQSKPPPPRPQRTSSGVEFNGFGRTTPGAENRRTPTPGQSPPKRSTAADATALAGRLVSEAQIAFLTRNYADADRLSREAIAKDRSCAGAHEVLGDIHAVRGDTDSAVKAYSYAIQFNPRNYSAQGKLDRLVGRQPISAPGRTTNVRRGLQANRTPAARQSREIVLAIISLGLFAAGCAVVAVLGQNPGIPVGGAIPWVTALSPNLMIALAIEGVIGGMLLAFYGRLWPIGREFSSSVRGDRKAPLLVILVMFSLVWFYFSLLVYIGVALGRNRSSASTVRVYSLVLALVALFTVMAATSDHGGWLETAAFAGNILFPCSILGWYLGDKVRLRPHDG